MKNYELIQQLSKMPAGADVYVNTTKQTEELIVTDENDGAPVYNICFDVQEVLHDVDENEINIDCW